VRELYGLPGNRVRIIHHGRTEPPRTSVPAPANSPYLLCVSSMEPNKNLPMLIEAFSQFSERWGGALVLAGREGRDVEQVRQAIAGAKLEDRIRLVLDPSDRELDQLYAGATAFAYPSIYEGFGLPLLEAMSHGLPVLANRMTSCPEVVGAAGVVVSKATAEDWADALVEVLQDAPRREKLASAARVRSLDFSWERAAKETWAAIEAALGDA
jgi:glycosyltransferase involved in cell wall biosynthesis